MCSCTSTKASILAVLSYEFVGLSVGAKFGHSDLGLTSGHVLIKLCWFVIYLELARVVLRCKKHTTFSKSSVRSTHGLSCSWMEVQFVKCTWVNLKRLRPGFLRPWTRYAILSLLIVQQIFEEFGATLSRLTCLSTNWLEKNENASYFYI